MIPTGWDVICDCGTKHLIPYSWFKPGMHTAYPCFMCGRALKVTEKTVQVGKRKRKKETIEYVFHNCIWDKSIMY